MREKKQDATQERRILTGMIVDTATLGRIAARWPAPDDSDGLFRSRWANLVAGWAVRFYNQYSRAPGPAIEMKFESWAAKGRDEKLVAVVDRFLGGLSDEYETNGQNLNSEYLLDVAGGYFNKVRLGLLAETIQDDIAAGREEEAHVRLASHTRLEIGVGAGIDVYQDADAMRDALAEQGKPLVGYPGDLGRFVNHAFERDAFVAFQGKAGSGKTWWLIDLAWRAMLKRKRVAFFQVGDLSQAQIMRRFMVRCAKRPVRACRVLLPTSLTAGDDYSCNVEREARTWKQPLSWQEAKKAADRVMKTKVRSKQSYLRCSVHPAGSVSIDGVREILLEWARDDFISDIVVIDYADLLAPRKTFIKDKRDQINDTWITMKGLSQTLHCLLVTATQSDADSYTAPLQRRGNFSDDRRKNDHVSSMLCINVTDAEKEEGRTRINVTKMRDAAYVETRVCHVAGSLAIGNPAMRSCLWTPPEDE